MSGINPNANVIIRMKGLGIGYYNHSSNPPVWEFIFLRGVPDHHLKIKVIEYFKDGRKTSTEYFPNQNIDEIDITSNAKNNGHRHQPEGNRFRRDENHSHYDSRWIVDLSSELHQKAVKLTQKRGQYPLSYTYMKINGATLYTHGRTNPLRPYRIVKKGVGSTPDHDIASSPRVMGHYVGLDIQWGGFGSKKTEISYAGSSIPDLKNSAAIDYYVIEIDNDCPSCPPYPDFHYYYDYLVNMGDEVYDEIAPGSESISLRESLFTSLGIEDLLLVGKDKTEQSLFKSLPFQDIVMRRVGKTDCHLVLVDELQDCDSLYYLKGPGPI
jgi:hypothetical protein